MESILVISTCIISCARQGFASCQPWHYPTDQVFVFIRQTGKDKGINRLVSAFLRLEQQRKNLKLLLVGDYEQELDPLLPKPWNISAVIRRSSEPVFKRCEGPPAISDTLVFPTYRRLFPNVVMQGFDGPSRDRNGYQQFAMMIIVQGQNSIIIPVKQVEPLI